MISLLNINRIKRFILFVTAFSFFISGNLPAQEPDYDNMPVINYSIPREYEIAEITISGVEFLQPMVLISLSGLSVGSTITVPGDDITDVINKFWTQGLFSDVKITATKIEEGKIYLDIYLRERPRLTRLEINGLNKSETTDLQEKINLRNGSQVTTDLLNNAVRIIKDHFIEKGFYNTEVEIVQKKDTSAGNGAFVQFNINKNDRVKIEEIEFVGNEVYTADRLKRLFKKTKAININFFKPSKLIQKEYMADKQKLLDFYNENGYRDAKLIRDSVSLVSPERIKLKIVLEEGEKYYFRNITWVGNTIYPAEILGRVLGVEKGDIFNQKVLDERLQTDEDAVSSLYLDNGYLFFSCDPVEVNVENDSIDFEMRIYEGKQATINRVIITGNTKTNEHVIRRELRTVPGDLFSKSDIIRTVRELASLGHFDPEKIEPNPIPNPADGTVDIEYKLVERANDQLEISGGWGAGMLVGTIGLRFSNFSAKNVFKPSAWRPIPTGDGQTLSVRAQSNGKWYQAYNFSFVEPWLGGKKPNSLSLSVFHTITSGGNYWSREVSDQNFKITGASIGFGRRLAWPDDFFTLYNEFTFQRYALNNWRNYFIFSNGVSKTISVTTVFARKSVDQLIYPRRGSNFSLSLQLTPPYSLMSNKDYTKMPVNKMYEYIEFHKWKFLAEWYTTLAGNLVLSTKAQFGYLGHYNDDIGPSPFEGFDVGGDGMSGYNLYGYETIALRGYENGSLTPRVKGLRAGNVYDKLTLELRYPITLNPSATLFGLVFLEAGNAWYSINEFNPFDSHRAAGVGLRAFLPMFGLLGIDWGYGFDPIPGKPNASGSQFHFTIGQQF
jgi:outer membrane protein insertion porin family